MRFLLLAIPFLLFSSCTYILLPEEYDVIAGEHCIVICDGTLSTDSYKEILSLSDTAYLQIQSLTDIELTMKISIYFNDLNIYQALGLAAANSIYLQEIPFCEYSTEDKLYVLRHEMTHLFFNLNYGDTTSFLFSEGVAEYYGYAESGDSDQESGAVLHLADWVGLSYYDYFLNYSDYEEITSSLYTLSHNFIYYWCETYGEQSLKELYPEITSENIIDRLENYSHTTFNEIVHDFQDYQGERL